MQKVLSMIKVHTKQGKKASQQKALQSSIPVYELHEIHVGENAALDIVAIHGHGGHWKNDWTDRKSGVFWLRDLLPEIVPDARILSYSYDTKDILTAPVERAGTKLLEELVKLRNDTETSTRPIIFFAHSFGGPLLQATLGVSHSTNGYVSSPNSSIVSFTEGIMFFAVSTSAMEGYIRTAAIPAPTRNDVVLSPEMLALRRDAVWLSDNGGIYQGFKHTLKICYFAETPEGNPDSGFIDDQRDLICHVAGDNVVRLNRSHGGMIRFSGRDEEAFKVIEYFLTKMVDEVKWIEETRRIEAAAKAASAPNSTKSSVDLRGTRRVEAVAKAASAADPLKSSVEMHES